MMPVSMRRVLLWALVALAASCSSLADRNAGRAAAVHRSASSACPQERGAGVSDIPTSCSQSSPLSRCTRDSDCAAGANGRCLQAGGPACDYFCSYDDCAVDSDCTGHVPCACRSSSSDTTANKCAIGSNCLIDADCGPGGSCSPSLLGSSIDCVCVHQSFCQPDGGGCFETGPDGVTKAVPCSCDGTCGHGYFCHTPKDSCLDDSDCAPGTGTCNFDLTSKLWMCTGQICPS